MVYRDYEGGLPQQSQSVIPRAFCQLSLAHYLTEYLEPVETTLSSTTHDCLNAILEGGKLLWALVFANIRYPGTISKCIANIQPLLLSTILC